MFHLITFPLHLPHYISNVITFVTILVGSPPGTIYRLYTLTWYVYPLSTLNVYHLPSLYPDLVRLPSFYPELVPFTLLQVVICSMLVYCHKWKKTSCLLTEPHIPNIPHTCVDKWIKWLHDDVIKWKYFPRYWPFVRGIHQSPGIPLTKASNAEFWSFCLICARITVELTIVRLVIGDAIRLIMTSL